MSTLTAWRFTGTEQADQAVLRLKQLGFQQAIDLQDVAVIRWPEYAAQPTAQEHVTAEGSKVSAMMSKVRSAGIDSSMIESVKGDMSPGTSALVPMSSDAQIDRVAAALEGPDMKLVRSNLSVEQEDQVRAAFAGPAGEDGGQPPGAVPNDKN
jgi:uncharacterized membrane protein